MQNCKCRWVTFSCAEQLPVNCVLYINLPAVDILSLISRLIRFPQLKLDKSR